MKEFQDSTDQLEADLYECSTVEITIEEHMKTDSRKSQKQNSRGNFQKYVQNVNELNEAVVGTRAIPRQVTDCYVKKQGEKNGRKVNFTQGYLPNCQQLYYAVEESLFFFHV